MDELLDALHAIIDARLIEHELLSKPARGGGKKTTAKGGKKKATDEVDVDTLKDKLTEVINEVGKDEAKAILKKFRVAKLSDLPEEKFEKFDAALDDALEAGGGGGEDDLFGK